MDPSENKDPLWELLGNASKTEASPYFSRRVLRNVKALAEQGHRGASAWSWQSIKSHLAFRLAVPSLVAAAAVAILLVVQLGKNPSSDSTTNLVDTTPTVKPDLIETAPAPTIETVDEAEKVDLPDKIDAVEAIAHVAPDEIESTEDLDVPTEIETVAYLGELMTVSDPGLLSDDALAELFF